jgi:hypothetical protein
MGRTPTERDYEMADQLLTILSKIVLTRQQRRFIIARTISDARAECLEEQTSNRLGYPKNNS